MKTCSVCGQSKHYTQFYLKNGRRMARCKDCEKKRVTAWRKRNPGKNQEYVRRFRERNPGYDIPQRRAYDKALAELRERHLDEFDRIYRKHKRREPMWTNA